MIAIWSIWRSTVAKIKIFDCIIFKYNIDIMFVFISIIYMCLYFHIFITMMYIVHCKCNQILIKFPSHKLYITEFHRMLIYNKDVLCCVTGTLRYQIVRFWLKHFFIDKLKILFLSFLFIWIFNDRTFYGFIRRRKHLLKAYCIQFPVLLLILCISDFLFFTSWYSIRYADKRKSIICINFY